MRKIILFIKELLAHLYTHTGKYMIAEGRYSCPYCKEFMKEKKKKKIGGKNDTQQTI